MAIPPAGTVTFLFTDIEGSTKLWERYPVAMRDALARHDHLMRTAIEAHNGYVFKTIGDAFCAAFPTPRDGLNAALDAQKALIAEPWPETGPIRARMALHTGAVTMRDGDYFGPPVNRVARLLATGHGGQILLSEATWHAVQGTLPAGVSLQDMGKQRLKDIGQKEHITQVVAPGLPTIFPKLKTPPSPVPGALAAAVLGLLALALYPVAFGYKSFSLNLFAPSTLLTNLTDLVVRLSTRGSGTLVALALLFLAVTAAAILLWRHATRVRRHRGSDLVRLAGRRVSLRTVAFLAGLTVLVTGALSYQEYLWRVELPLPEPALGLAFTKEAAAASFNNELTLALEAGGLDKQVETSDLPVYFDSRDIDEARELGKRIDADSVLIYREDGDAAAGEGRYVAYIVITEPVAVAAFGEAGDLSAAGGEVGVMTLRARSREEVVTDLVNAAAGIIAYDQHQNAVAIALLKQARPEVLTAPNAGIVNYYLGLALRQNGEMEAAKAAQDRVIQAFEERLDASGRLGTQDQLFLARAYADRCFMAGLDDDWDGAIATCEKATKYRESLLAKQDALFRPAEVEITYYWLYGLLADAYRAMDRPEDEKYWQNQATATAEALGLRSDANDAYTLIYQSKSRIFAGDCVGGVDALDQALAKGIADQRMLVDAHINLGIFHYFQGRLDLAEFHWREAAKLEPNDTVSRENLANLEMTRALGPDYLDPTALANADVHLREMLAIDPTHQGAHQDLASNAWTRAQALAVMDATAALNGDDLSVTKSQGFWDSDPGRVQAAVDAYGAAIQERRVVATELRPDDPAAAAEVAAVYGARLDLTYSGLLTYGIHGASDPRQDDEWVAQTGERVLDDAAQVREWSAKVLENPDAGRAATLVAWKALLGALQREWGWYYFDVLGDDPAKAEEVATDYRQAVADAVAAVEAEPIDHPEEADPAQLIYLEASTFALLVDGDQAKSEDYQAKAMAVAGLMVAAPDEGATEATPVVAGWEARTEHLETRCLEVREQTAGDKELAAGDEDAAAEHYRAALAINPRHLPSLLGLARTLRLQDDLPGAVAQAQAATEVDPNDPRAWALLGHLHVLTGDDAGARAAYDRYLAAVAPLVPQARMSSLRGAIGDLRGALDGDPARAAGIASLVPPFGAALDAMTDTAGTYQGPALYAQLGALALYADDAATAEPLLRKAVGFGQNPDGSSDCAGFVPTTCDAHQPAAWAGLALAALAQGRDGKAEVDAAMREVESPLWARVDGFDTTTVLGMMRDEVAAYTKRFPDRAARVQPLIDAIDAEPARLERVVKGLDGPTYSSPTFGYGLTWDDSWTVASVDTNGTYDSIQLGNGSSEVLIEGAVEYGQDVAGCVDGLAATLAGNADFAGFAPATTSGGGEATARGTDRVWGAYTYESAGQPYVLYLECRSVDAGAYGIKLVAILPVAAYDQQRDAVDALFGRISPDAPADAVATAVASPVASPVAADGWAPVALPELDLTPVAEPAGATPTA